MYLLSHLLLVTRSWVLTVTCLLTSYQASTVQSGLIGNLYGVDVYVSANCATIEAAADNTASSVDTRAALLFHKDAIVLAEQQSVRSQTQYKQEYLSTLYTADCLYGVQVYRPEAGFVLAVLLQ